jgi:hypothetical protein
MEDFQFQTAALPSGITGDCSQAACAAVRQLEDF